jgi:hypothetical protein
MPQIKKNKKILKTKMQKIKTTAQQKGTLTNNKVPVIPHNEIVIST